MDNFSKVIPMKIPNMDKGTYSSCLWAGFALRSYSGDDEKLSLDIQVVDGEIQPAMPSLQQLLNEKKSIFNELKAVDEIGIAHFSDSLCEKYNIRSVLLRPYVNQRQQPELYKKLQNATNSMQYLHPEKLVKTNVGSNRGLLKIMRDLLDEAQASRPRRYKVINADINIFKRIVKVLQIHVLICYDSYDIICFV